MCFKSFRSHKIYRMSAVSSGPERGQTSGEGGRVEGGRVAVVNIVRGADGERHMFYDFGLRHASIVICAACFGVIDLVGSTLDQAADLMYTHWTNAAKNNKQLNTDHSYEHRATRTAVREQLAMSNGVSGTKGIVICTKSTSTLINQSVFEAATGRSLLGMPDLSYAKVRVCSRCFKVVNGVALSCCSPAIALEMNTVKRQKYVTVAYASGDEYEGILRAAADHLAESACSPVQDPQVSIVESTQTRSQNIVIDIPRPFETRVELVPQGERSSCGLEGGTKYDTGAGTRIYVVNQFQGTQTSQESSKSADCNIERVTVIIDFATDISSSRSETSGQRNSQAVTLKMIGRDRFSIAVDGHTRVGAADQEDSVSANIVKELEIKRNRSDSTESSRTWSGYCSKWSEAGQIQNDS